MPFFAPQQNNAKKKLQTSETLKQSTFRKPKKAFLFFIFEFQWIVNFSIDLSQAKPFQGQERNSIRLTKKKNCLTHIDVTFSSSTLSIQKSLFIFRFYLEFKYRSRINLESENFCIIFFWIMKEPAKRLNYSLSRYSLL